MNGNLEPKAPTSSEIRARIQTISPFLGVLAALPTEHNFAPYESLEAKEKIEEALLDIYPDEAWRQDDFDLLTYLSKLNGPFVELGGPSLGGYALVNLGDVYKQTRKKIFVTNVRRAALQQNLPDDIDKAVHIWGFMDASSLPFADESIGALFANGLGHLVSPALIEQAPRVLEKDGLLITGYMSSLDVALALHAGLDVKEYTRGHKLLAADFAEQVWHTVFQKP